MSLPAHAGLLLVPLFSLAPWLAGRYAGLLLPGRDQRLARCLAVFVTGATVVIGLVIGLGTAGRLTRPAIAVALLAVLAGSLVLWWRLPDAPTGPAREKASLPGLVASQRPLGRLGIPLVCFIALVAIQVVGLVVLSGWREPPLAYDALMYHLVFPAEWIQRARLALVPTTFAAPANSYFPCNAEASFAYAMLATGDERLVNLSQLPFLLAGAAALAGIGRKCGLGWTSSTFVALLFVSCPEVATQAGSALADLDLASTFLLTVFFLLEYVESGSRPVLLFAGLSAGLMAGTKSLGLLFGALLVPLALLAVRQRRNSTWTAALPDLALLFAACLPLGAFWYLRNWELTGNPLFPLEVHAGSLTIFPGAHGRAEMLRSHFHLPPTMAAISALSRLWGPLLDLSGLPAGASPPRRGAVPLLLILILLSIVPAMRRLAALPGSRPPRLYVLLLPLPLLAAHVLLNPYNSQYRFLLAALALSLLPLGAALDGRGPAGVLLSACAALLAVSQQVGWGPTGPLDPRRELFAFPCLAIFLASLAGGVIASLAMAAGLWPPSRPAPPWLTGRRARISSLLPAFAVAAGIALLAGLHPAFHHSYLDHIDDSPDGQRALVWGKVRQERAQRAIAYTGFNQPYPLYGEDLRNRVHYIAVDGRQSFNLHDYLPLLGGQSGLVGRRSYKPAYERQQPSREAWLKGIDMLGIELLVVARFNAWDQEEFDHDPEGFPVEEDWARSFPDRFQPWIATPDMRLYRVLPAAAR